MYSSPSPRILIIGALHGSLTLLSTSPKDRYYFFQSSYHPFPQSDGFFSLSCSRLFLSLTIFCSIPRHTGSQLNSHVHLLYSKYRASDPLPRRLCSYIDAPNYFLPKGLLEGKIGLRFWRWYRISLKTELVAIMPPFSVMSVGCFFSHHSLRPDYRKRTFFWRSFTLGFLCAKFALQHSFCEWYIHKHGPKTCPVYVRFSALCVRLFRVHREVGRDSPEPGKKLQFSTRKRSLLGTLWTPGLMLSRHFSNFQVLHVKIICLR